MLNRTLYLESNILHNLASQIYFGGETAISTSIIFLSEWLSRAQTSSGTL